MSTPHVCFADMPQYGDSNKRSNNNAASNCSAAYEDDIAPLSSQRRYCKERSLSPSCNSSSSPTPRYERNMGFFRQLSRRFGLRSNDDLIYSIEDDAHSSSTDSCSSTTGTVPPMQCSVTSSLSSTASTATRSHIKEMHGSSMEQISCASSETSSNVDIDDQQQQQQQPQHDSNTATNNKTATDAAKARKSASRASFSRLQRRSTSSLRRAFESFSLSSRSLSCSGATPPMGAALATNKDRGNSSSSNSSTPIKSALKSSSNMELNKKTTAARSTTANMCANNKTTKSKSKPPPQRILRQPVSYTYLKGISGLPTQRVPRSAVCCQYVRR